jgi:hypothetical protein
MSFSLLALRYVNASIAGIVPCDRTSMFDRVEDQPISSGAHDKGRKGDDFFSRVGGSTLSACH